MKNPENVIRGRRSKMRGKAVEREVAKLLHEILQAADPDNAALARAWRNADNGSQVADVETEATGPLLDHPLANAAVEVKSTKGPTTQRRLKAWSQAKAAEAQTGKTPLVIETNVDEGTRTFWLVQKLDRPPTHT
jgi:hypothetical protein